IERIDCLILRADASKALMETESDQKKKEDYRLKRRADLEEAARTNHAPPKADDLTPGEALKIVEPANESRRARRFAEAIEKAKPLTDHPSQRVRAHAFTIIGDSLSEQNRPQESHEAVQKALKLWGEVNGK